jgi:hypothetical protein
MVCRVRAPHDTPNPDIFLIKHLGGACEKLSSGGFRTNERVGHSFYIRPFDFQHSPNLLWGTKIKLSPGENLSTTAFPEFRCHQLLESQYGILWSFFLLM